MKKKKIKKVLIALLVGMALCVVVLNIIRVSGLLAGLRDMYFIEYTEKESVIYRYDVLRGRKAVVLKLEGSYYGCRLNRSENCIIGVFHSDPPFYQYDEESCVWLRCNLSDGTTTEIEASEVEKIDGRAYEIEDRLRKRVPAEIIRNSSGRFYWSMDEETGVFATYDAGEIWLYHTDTGTSECILEARPHHSFTGNNGFGFFGIDASGRYVFYQDNLVLLFGDIKSYYIYDTKTGLRTPIIGVRYEQGNNRIEYVREITDSEIAAIKSSQVDTDGREEYIDDEK